MRRTIISGVVSFDRTRDISAERRSGVKRSTMTESFCGYTPRCLHCRQNVDQNSFPDNRAHAVADHSEAVPHGRMKAKIVWKSLYSRCLSDGNHPVLIGMDWPNRLVGTSIHSGPRQ